MDSESQPENQDQRRYAPGHAPLRIAAFATASAATFALGAIWRIDPDPFIRFFYVPYPHARALEYHLDMLRNMPWLFFATAFVFASMSAAHALASRQPSRMMTRRLLSSRAEAMILSALFAVAVWLSYHHWVLWGRPGWDNYWRAGEILHYAARLRDGAAVARLLTDFPHSPSPLTPVLIALGMFAWKNPVGLLQLYSLAATVGSLFVLRALTRRLAPKLPFLPVGALFLANAATIRNAAFIQLDAINGFFVLAFFLLWLWQRDQPSGRRLAALSAFVTLAVFQKTTLFPLMAVPTLTVCYEAARMKKIDIRRFFSIGATTAAIPAGLFAAYIFSFGIAKNFSGQVELMGTGWNELDFSFSRFAYATIFLLGPYIPAVMRNRRIAEPPYMACVLFVALFFASLVAVRGPFWGRYYSHLIGPFLLLALPHWERAINDAERILPLLVYLASVMLIGYTLVGFNLI